MLDKIKTLIDDNIKKYIVTVPSQYWNDYLMRSIESSLNNVKVLAAFTFLYELFFISYYFFIYPRSTHGSAIEHHSLLIFLSVIYMAFTVVYFYLSGIAVLKKASHIRFCKRLVISFFYISTVYKAYQAGLEYAITGTYFTMTITAALLSLFVFLPNVHILPIYSISFISIIGITNYLTQDKGDLTTSFILFSFIVTLSALVTNLFNRNFQINTYLSTKMLIETNQQLGDANIKLNRLNHELEQSYMYDSLTKAFNRNSLHTFMSRLMANDAITSLSLCIVDIDHFKHYNDSFGLNKGDETLYKVANCIKSFINEPNSIFARLGGGEFIFVIPDITGEALVSKAERIRDAVESMEIKNPASLASPYVTVSIGAVSRDKKAFRVYDELIMTAYAATFEAKKTGRNRVVADIIAGKATFVAQRNSFFSLPGEGEDLEKLKTIMSVLYLAVYSANVDTGKLEFVPKITDYIGGSQYVFETYKDFLPFIYKPDREIFVQLMQNLHSDRKDILTPVKWRLNLKNGTQMWVSSVVKFMTVESDLPYQAVGSINDFDSEMRAQEMAQLISDAQSSYTYFLDVASNMMVVNDRFKEDFGLDSSEIENACDYYNSLIYKDDLADFQALNPILNKDVPLSYYKECRMITKTKGIIWAAIRLNAKRDSEGNCVMLAGSVIDITEQVRAQQRNKLILEGSFYCVYVFDFKNNTLEMSPKIQELINVDELFVHNGLESWINHIVPEDREIFQASLEPLFQGRTHEQNLEYRLIGKNGESIWVADRGKASLDEEGKHEYLAGSIFDIRTMGQYNNYLEQQSMADKLTGLPNRLKFYKDMELTFSLDYPTDIGCVLMVDILGFKNINSLYGMHIGDEVIKTVALKLKLILNRDNSLYHFGADTFVLIFVQSEIDKINEFVDNMREIALQGLIVGNKDIRITFSAGGCYWSSCDTPEDLLTNAEIVIRKLKTFGRSTSEGVLFEMFNPKDKEIFIKRLELESNLGHAIEDGFSGFEPYFQPLYSVRKNVILGVEALLRWKDKDGRIISPAQVIPALQSIGMFHIVESWMLEQAAQHCRKWIDMGAPEDFIINVNVSPQQISKVDIDDKVFEVLRKNNLNVNNIVIELTEESLISDLHPSMNRLKKLRDSNVLLAIDDFGTGYSSLSYLRDMPAYELKVDRSFILNIDTDHSAKTFVGSIINLAKSMDFIVCVEGVETATQLAILKELRADILQGYYFSKPLSALEFETKFLPKIINTMPYFE